MEDRCEGIKRYVEGKSDFVYELSKYNFDGAERYELTEEQYEKMRENLELGEKSAKIGATPESIWHYINKSQVDLPINGERILFFVDREKINYSSFCNERELAMAKASEQECWTGAYNEYGDLTFRNDDYEMYCTRAEYSLTQVTKWAYISDIEKIP